MNKLARSKAEQLFATNQKRDKQVLKDKEKARQERSAQVARLRALRLAKEAAEREPAEKTVATKEVTSASLPQPYRTY